MEMRDERKEHKSTATGHGRMRLVPPIAVAVALGLAVLVAAVMLFMERGLRWPRPDVPSATPTLPSFGGETALVPLLLGAILLVLVGAFVLLLVLVICVCKCGCAKGIPLPGLPDLRGIATILRGIAQALKDGANKIETANGIVNQARDTLTGDAIEFKVWVPKYASKGEITIGLWTGEVFVPVPGEGEWKSPFDDGAREKLRKFANDVTGKSALDGASAMLRDKASVLEDQANTLDGQT